MIGQALGDFPAIASSTYTTSTVPIHALNMGIQHFGSDDHLEALARRHDPFGGPFKHQVYQQIEAQKEQNMAAAATRRLVKVVIVDPHESIPLDQCMLYSGDEKLTDATDQELFFEIDIKDVLSKHNDKRTKIVDKKVKERTEYLEAAKIRDLKMVVVNIAQF